MCVDPGKVSDDARWRLPGCPDVQAATGSPGASGSVQAVRSSCCLKVSLHLVAKVTVLKLSTFFFFLIMIIYSQNSSFVVHILGKISSFYSL